MGVEPGGAGVSTVAVCAVGVSAGGSSPQAAAATRESIAKAARVQSSVDFTGQSYLIYAPGWVDGLARERTGPVNCERHEERKAIVHRRHGWTRMPPPYRLGKGAEMAEKRHPQGLLAACDTPWTESFELDEGVFRRHVEQLLASGAENIYVMGTAGEGYAVTDTQFRQIVDVFVDATVGADVTRMVCVISISMGHMIERHRLRPRQGRAHVSDPAAIVGHPDGRRGAHVLQDGVRGLPRLEVPALQPEAVRPHPRRRRLSPASSTRFRTWSPPRSTAPTWASCAS